MDRITCQKHPLVQGEFIAYPLPDLIPGSDCQNSYTPHRLKDAIKIGPHNARQLVRNFLRCTRRPQATVVACYCPISAEGVGILEGFIEVGIRTQSTSHLEIVSLIQCEASTMPLDGLIAWRWP